MPIRFETTEPYASFTQATIKIVAFSARWQIVGESGAASGDIITGNASSVSSRHLQSERWTDLL